MRLGVLVKGRRREERRINEGSYPPEFGEQRLVVVGNQAIKFKRRHSDEPCRLTNDALWRVTHAPRDVVKQRISAACGPVHSSGWLCGTSGRRQPHGLTTFQQATAMWTPLNRKRI